jgi:putative DNA primase/helicase
MIEAVVQATPQPAEAARVLALYAQAQASPETEAAAIAEADKLTFEMIEETAEWLKVPKPKNPEQARKKSELAKGANCVRAWWLDQVKKLCGEREAGEFTRHWEEAFAEAATPEEADFAEKLDAETARLAKAKAQPEPEGDKKNIAEAQPQAEPGAETEPEPEAEPQTRDANPPRLSRQAPLDSAKLFAAAKLYQRGALATYYYHGQWWQWNGCFYAPVADDRITAWVTLFLDSASCWGGDGQVRFKPKSKDTEELVKALRVHCLIEDDPPQWFDGREAEASRLLVFRNCLVDCETGEVSALTPKLWVHGGANIDYDPKAQCPRWERFLEEVFPGDGESQRCIEEQLGYGMTNDTRFEKAAIWVGVRRSGKTTIVWVQEQLAGPGACTDLNFHDWVSTENSHSGIIGKKVGVFSDVRLKPPKTYGNVGYDPGGIDHKSAQLLLKIIGRDKISIKTKYHKMPWEGRPGIKIIITSNVVPNLQDAGGVLASRFIKVAFARSFAGKEDVNLRSKLTPELPGIAVRCLAAYRRLLRRGYFIQPQSAADLEAQIEEQANGFLQFMNECFEADPDAAAKGVWVEVFYNRFCTWCDENGRPDLREKARTKQKLIGHINQIERWRHLKVTRTNSEPRRYPGIKLRKPG